MNSRNASHEQSQHDCTSGPRRIPLSDSRSAGDSVRIDERINLVGMTYCFEFGGYHSSNFGTGEEAAAIALRKTVGANQYKGGRGDSDRSFTDA